MEREGWKSAPVYLERWRVNCCSAEYLGFFFCQKAKERKLNIFQMYLSVNDDCEKSLFLVLPLD